MSKIAKVILLSTILIGFVSLPLISQSRETGAIRGRVTDETGLALPGATVKLSSPDVLGGEKSIVTGANGKFRFAALMTGTYILEASLDGFNTQQVPDIRLSVGKTLTVNIKLTPKSLEEVVEVIARAPLIDVKDSQQATIILEKELLTDIPIERSYGAVVTLSPGHVGGRLFGGAGGQDGTSYNIDGVNVSDPFFAGGWVLMDWNTIEESNISGVGANAEYDGYTGGSINIITRSGGNDTTGGLELYYRGKTWRSDNTGDLDWEYAPDYDNRDRVEPSFFIGGPLKKDSLWYFFNLQYATYRTDVEDFPETTFDWQPRIYGKLTAQFGENDRLQTTLAWEADHGNYGYAYPGWPVETSEKYRSDDKFVNINWLHIFSDSTFMETKLGGYQAIQTLKGYGGDAYPRIDDVTGDLSGNSFIEVSGWGRLRFQINAAVSHHAEDFIAGDHDFKLGAEFEHAYVDLTYDPYQNGRLYIDYYGPFLRYDWGPDVYALDGGFDRLSLFAQDSWSISDRLTVNPGLRLNINRMGLKGENLINTNSLAPRIGITFDVFGDNSTAFKAHYGRYFDQARMNDLYPVLDVPNFYGYWWNGTAWEQIFVDVIRSATVDPDLKWPGTDQFSVALERELARDLSLEVAFIHKKFINILGAVETQGQWEATTYYDPITQQTYDLWNLTLDGDSEILLTNPKGGTYDTVPVTPEARWMMLQVNLTKRYANRWQMNASYTYSLSDGNFDLGEGWGGRMLMGNDFFRSRNEQVFADGYSLSHRPHVFKFLGSVLLPWDINFGAVFVYRSGARYNNITRTASGAVSDYRDRVEFRTEKRGALSYPNYYKLDFRFEKQFRIGSTKLSALIDFFNLLNSNIVEETQNNLWDSGYGKVIWAMDPRQFHVGVRFHF